MWSALFWDISLLYYVIPQKRAYLILMCLLLYTAGLLPQDAVRYRIYKTWLFKQIPVQAYILIQKYMVREIHCFSITCCLVSVIYQSPWCHIPAQCVFVVTTMRVSNLPCTTVSSQENRTYDSVAGRNVTAHYLKSHCTCILISVQSVISQVENKLTYALKSS
jgi:hypothetical protein